MEKEAFRKWNARVVKFEGIGVRISFGLITFLKKEAFWNARMFTEVCELFERNLERIGVRILFELITLKKRVVLSGMFIGI